MIGGSAAEYAIKCLQSGKVVQGNAATRTIYIENSHSVLELSGESISRDPLHNFKPVAITGFNLLQKMTDRRIASVEKVHAFSLQLIIYAVRLSECHTIDESYFIMSYRIKHKSSKNGSIIVLKGHCVFIAKTGAGEPAPINYDPTWYA